MTTTRGVVSKLKAAQIEAEHLFRMTGSWSEWLGVAGLMAKLHVARALPIDTYSWDAAVRLHGSSYCFGLRTSEIYVVEEVYDYKMYDRSADFIAQKGWVVFDVGANVGVVSVLHAQREAQVYAFEPNPDCYRRLVKNISGNRLENRILPLNLAVGSFAGTGTMQVLKGGTTGGTVQTGARAASTAARVAITTLDQIAPALGVSRIDLLKVDVEGAEVDVLLGALGTLQITERIVLEYHSRALLRRVEEVLGPFGFVRELRVEYYPEDLATDQQEVGIIYYSRPRAA